MTPPEQYNSPIRSVKEYKETQRFLSELIKRYDGLTDVGRHYNTQLPLNIQNYTSKIKDFEKAHPKKEGRTFSLSNGEKMCNECCNGDRCDDSTHSYRGDCWYCLGTGYNASC